MTPIYIFFPTIAFFVGAIVGTTILHIGIAFGRQIEQDILDKQTARTISLLERCHAFSPPQGGDATIPVALYHNNTQPKEATRDESIF